MVWQQGAMAMDVDGFAAMFATAAVCEMIAQSASAPRGWLKEVEGLSAVGQEAISTSFIG